MLYEVITLKEFREKRKSLVAEFKPLIQKYYKKMGWEYPESAMNIHPLITVQGGIGNHGEVCRLRKDFGMDRITSYNVCYTKLLRAGA